MGDEEVREGREERQEEERRATGEEERDEREERARTNHVTHSPCSSSMLWLFSDHVSSDGKYPFLLSSLLFSSLLCSAMLSISFFFYIFFSAFPLWFSMRYLLSHEEERSEVILFCFKLYDPKVYWNYWLHSPCVTCGFTYGGIGRGEKRGERWERVAHGRASLGQRMVCFLAFAFLVVFLFLPSYPPLITTLPSASLARSWKV